MSRQQRNRRVLDMGFSSFEKSRNEYMLDSIVKSATDLLRTVAKYREFQGFTGNTQTSYACGIYVNKRCRRIILQTNWEEPPRIAKIPAGKFVYLENPYEGDARGVRAKRNIQTDGDFGQNTSVRFLLEYKDTPSNGWGLVMTTGTEYSEYLETVRGLDVLTGTAEEAISVIMNNFKQMPPEWI